MSKFNNPSRALAPPRPAPASPETPKREVLRPAPRAALATEFPAAVSQPTNQSPLVTIGFVAMCLMMISGPLNDWAFMFFGGKAYLSVVTVIATPIIWLVCGNALDSLRGSVAVLWLVFLGLILLGLPFSYWRTGSITVLLDYVRWGYCYFFYITAFVTSIKRCKVLMLLNVVVATMVLISCIGIGGVSEDGRFRIAGSMFSGNSNDLALQLTLGLTSYMYLLYVGGITRKIAAVAGMIGCLVYMLKTGSRGCFLATILLFVFTFLVSKRKALMLAIAVPLFTVALIVMPSGSMQRFRTVFEAGNTAAPLDGNDASAVASKMQREELIKKSLELTLTHPLFGVGVGQFAVATAGEAAKKGEWSSWLGTHNSYTQVSSECGIPAVACYLAIIFICFRTSYRLYRMAVGKPQFLEIEALAFCLFSTTLVYAVSTFFFHIAYSGSLPVLSGEIMCLNTFAYPLLVKARGNGYQSAAAATGLGATIRNLPRWTGRSTRK